MPTKKKKLSPLGPNKYQHGSICPLGFYWLWNSITGLKLSFQNCTNRRFLLFNLLKLKARYFRFKLYFLVARKKRLIKFKKGSQHQLAILRWFELTFLSSSCSPVLSNFFPFLSLYSALPLLVFNIIVGGGWVGSTFFLTFFPVKLVFAKVGFLVQSSTFF